MVRGFGRAVALLRAERGMSQYRLAKESGLTQTGLRWIETADRGPTLASALAIAEALGVGLEELVRLARRAAGEADAAAT